MNYDELYDRLCNLEPTKEEIKLMTREARGEIKRLSSREERHFNFNDVLINSIVHSTIFFLLMLAILFLINSIVEISNFQMKIIMIVIYSLWAGTFVVLFAVRWHKSERQRKQELEKFTTALYTLQNYVVAN